MITLKKINLTNFLSHENTTIEFKDNQKLLIDGRSGTGKSAIVDALIWVLYGQGRVDNRSLIKRGKKMVKVDLLMEDDGKLYKVERIVTIKGKQDLMVLEGESMNKLIPIKANGTRAIQEYLEKQILHSSYLLFINSIVYPQDNIESFVKQTAARKKEIILEIINATSYDEYYERIRVLMTDLQNKKIIDTSLLESLSPKQEIIELASRVKEYEKRQTEMEQKKKEDEITKEKLMSEIQTVSIELGKLEGKNPEKEKILNEISRIKSQMFEAHHILGEVVEVEVEILSMKESISGIDKEKAELDSLNQKKIALDIWKSEMMKLLTDKPVDYGSDDRIKEINRQLIIRMSEKFDLCPKLNEECPLFVEGRNKEIKRLEEELTIHTGNKKKYEEDTIAYNNKVVALGLEPMIDNELYNNLVAEMEKAARIEKRIIEMTQSCMFTKENAQNTIKTGELAKNDLQNSLLAIENELKGINTLLEVKSFKTTALAAINDEIMRLQEVINDNMGLLAAAMAAEAQIKNNELKTKEIKEQIKENDEHLKNLQLLKEAFGPNGIKAILIDYVIPRLEDRINDILSKLSDFRIRLDTQKVGVTGDTTIEGLFIRIYNELGEEFDYDSYSGGQKVKIQMAIFEALAEIQNINFRILDESIVALDEDSTEKFVEVMSNLQERVNQVVVISHLRNIKDMFVNKITVNKLNGTSVID